MANFHEVMDMNQRSKMPHKGETKSELKELTHSRSSNGGYVFEHRMHQPTGEYKEPEMHTFGKDEGRQALEHFAEHAGLSEHLPKEAAGAAE